jgi:hypothetical protein
LKFCSSGIYFIVPKVYSQFFPVNSECHPCAYYR